MGEALRHVDHGERLRSFADEVLVRCALCETPGRVATRVREADGRGIAEFRCTGCDLHVDSTSGAWFGEVEWFGQRRCGHCGHRSLTVSEVVAAPQVTTRGDVDVTCAACGRASPVAVAPLRRIPDDHAIDPHFGLPLLLAVTSRHGVVWAYNERHLGELQAYVGATLRTRQGSGNGSLFSRLPAWMKAAKHRTEMLKSFARLQKICPANAASAP